MRVYMDFKSKPTYGPIIDVVNSLGFKNEVLYSHSKQFRINGLKDNILCAYSNRDVEKFKPQVVFSAYSSFAALAFHKVSIKAPIVNYKFIHTTMDDIISSRFKEFPFSYKVREALNLAALGMPKRLWLPDRFLLPNRRTKRDLVGLGIAKEKLEVLQWGIRAEKYNAFADSASHNIGHKEIVYAGPLHRLRFSVNLINAFSQICRIHSDAKLNLLFRRTWDHNLLHKVVRLVRQKGIESRVRIITKPLTHHQLIDQINRSAVVVLPYMTSGIVEMPPLTLIEAMALSKPIITNRGIATSEIIQNEHNGLVIEQTVQDLVNAIDDLFTNQKMAISIGQRARQSVERNFNFRKFCERLQDTLESVV